MDEANWYSSTCGVVQTAANDSRCSREITKCGAHWNVKSPWRKGSVRREHYSWPPAKDDQGSHSGYPWGWSVAINKHEWASVKHIIQCLWIAPLGRKASCFAIIYYVNYTLENLHHIFTILIWYGYILLFMLILSWTSIARKCTRLHGCISQ